jgi:hypothetical protein
MSTRASLQLANALTGGGRTAQVNQAAKVLNSVSNLLGGKKKKKNKNKSNQNNNGGSTMQTRMHSVQQPSAKSVVQTGTAMRVTSPSPYEFLFAHLIGQNALEILLVPWQTYAYTGVGGDVTWDPQLLLDLETKREYRLKSAYFTYLGTAPTSVSNQVYMGGARSVNTPYPSYDEFTLLEKHYIGPMYEPGVKIKLPHDSDWHDINTAITINSTATDKKVFAAGVAYIAQDTAGATGRYQIHLEFEFRGKDPVVQSTVTMVGATNAVPADNVLFANPGFYGIGPRIQWNFRTGLPEAPNQGWVTSGYGPGYYLMGLDSNVLDATGFADGVMVMDITGTDVSASEVVYLTGSTGAQSSLLMLLHLKQTGDQVVALVAAPNAAATFSGMSIAMTRVSPDNALQLYRQLVNPNAINLPI